MGQPTMSSVGPVVISKQLQRKVLINPKYNLRTVIIPMPTSVTCVQRRCQPFIRNMVRGWENWINNLSPKRKVVHKRDPIAKVLGGQGTGLSIKNAADAAVLAMKIRSIGINLASLEQPISELFGKIASLKFEMSQIMIEYS